jgi:integrase
MTWSTREKKPLRRTFSSLAQARRWRQEAQVALRGRELDAPSPLLLSEAAEQWLDGARRGVVRTRSGERFKPSAIRSYEAALRNVLLPELGHLRLTAITRARIQDLADSLLREGKAPATVANAILPLRAIYRRLVDREQLTLNPTERLSLPRDRGKRDRIAEPGELSALLAALDDSHRVLWATAAYTGLRRGELQALRWETVDLAAGILRVERSWDRVAGLVEPKSRTGRRKVPIPGALVPELVAHLSRQRAGAEFVFEGPGGRPFDPSNLIRTAKRAWRNAGLKPLGFHEARHTYASLMIAAGVNAKALCSYLGHSSITVTIDRYGHLMPGNEREAAERLDAYLDGARGADAAPVAGPGSHDG